MEQKEPVESEAELEGTSEMVEGTVKWFSNLKSCAFISCDGAFAHCSAIQGFGFRLLSAGGRVEPSVKQREKGPLVAGARSLETAVGSSWLQD